MNSTIPPPRPDWAFFFDIDGTLVDIAESPERVRVDPVLRRLIKVLHRNTGGAVALISGRAIADIDALFPGYRLAAAGQHGAERRDASGAVAPRGRRTTQFIRVRDDLSAVVTRHPSLRLEDKGLSLALHYRQAPQLAGFVHRLMRAVHTERAKDFQLQIGKRVVELLPAGSNKGAAVRQFMTERPFRGRIPVFIGDDATDEAAFSIVNRMGGHSVKVGPGTTTARWRLSNVAAVRSWLTSGAATAVRTRHRDAAGGPP